MKKLNIISLGVTLMLCCTSCNSILDKSPLDLRTEEDVWSDPSLAQIYLNDLWYATVRRDAGNKFETWFSMYSGPLAPGLDVSSDNCYSRWNRGATGIKNDASLTPASITDQMGAFDSFIDIRRVNIAIDHLTEGCENFNEDVKNDMLGQAYFAKGLIYITRAKTFGGYPIIEKTLTPEDDLSLSRASIKETFDYGINCLNKAAGLINDNAPAGRPGKGAVYGLLSEANLLAAAYIKYGIINGVEENIDLTSYYNAAIKAVEELDKLGIYSLEPSDNWVKQFNDFDYAAGSPSEILLASFTPPGLYDLNSSSPVDFGNYLPTMYADILKTDVVNNYGGIPYSGYTLTEFYQTITPNPKAIDEAFYITDEDGVARRWEESMKFRKYINVNDGIYSLNQTAINAGYTDIAKLMYEDRDKRFYSTVAYDGCKYFGNAFDTREGGNMNPNSFKSSSSNQGAVTGYLFVKMVPQTQAWTLKSLSGFHRTCLRLSRAYLNAGEAYLMKEDWSHAREYINKTRVTHGGLKALQSETGDELWKIYIDERNAELMLENDRYYTLMRWGIKNGAEIIDQLNFGQIKQFEISQNGQSYKYVDLKFEGSNNNFVFNRYRYLFPVPQNLLEENPNYAPQNPRY